MSFSFGFFRQTIYKYINSPNNEQIKSLQCEFHYIMNQSQFDVLYNRFDYQIENESA